MKILFEKAIEQISRYLGIDAKQLLEYSKEDIIGGYNPEGGTWPSGSVWEVEGKILYALTRLYKPDTVIEIGSNYGCSTSHFVSALDVNGKGNIYAVDLSFSKIRVQSERLNLNCGDGVEISRYLTAKNIIPDILFEDGPHDKNFTREVLKEYSAVMKPGGIIVIHDVDHFLVGKNVTDGAEEAIGSFNHLLIDPSDCGLGVWIKK